MFISNSNTAPFQMKPARKTFGKRQSYKSTLSLSYCVNIKLVVQKIKRNIFFDISRNPFYKNILTDIEIEMFHTEPVGCKVVCSQYYWETRNQQKDSSGWNVTQFRILRHETRYHKKHKMLFYNLIKLSKSMSVTKTPLYISLNLQTHLVVVFEISMHLHNEFTKGIPIIICINVIFILTNCRTL